MHFEQRRSTVFGVPEDGDVPVVSGNRRQINAGIGVRLPTYWRPLLAAALTVLILDQAIKLYVFVFLPRTVIIPSAIEIIPVLNKDGPAPLLLLPAPLPSLCQCACCLLIWLKLARARAIRQMNWNLLLAAGFSNGIEFAIRGGVVDYLAIRIPFTQMFAVANFADLMILVACTVAPGRLARLLGGPRRGLRASMGYALP